MSEQNQGPVNILKVRDDYEPLKFVALDDYKFKVISEPIPLWAKEELTIKDLRSRIEPWLTSLFQSEHLSLLAGSGLTHAIHLLAAKKGAAGMYKLELKNFADQINTKANESAKLAKRKEDNLEDQLRVANELLRGLEIQGDDKTEELRAEIKNGMEEFASSILKSEEGIAIADEHHREEAFNTLVTFLMSFASRIGVRDRLNIFTTNYDLYSERGIGKHQR